MSAPDSTTTSTRNLHLKLKNLRERLIDLSLRNRLLNFRDVGSQTLPLCPCDPARIYDLLVSKERTLEIEGSLTPEEPNEDKSNGSAESAGPVKRPAIVFDGDDTTEDLEVGILRSRDSAMKTEARTNSLYRKYRECLDAFGSNLCYVALGFLEWTDTRRDSEEKLYAPLILVPVTMGREKRRPEDASSELMLDLQPRRGRPRKKPTVPFASAYRFTVSYDGEDVSDNVALRLKLASLPGGPALPEFDGDEDDLDLDRYFDTVERMLKRLPAEVVGGWKVVRAARLAFFASAKEAMYRDLDPVLWPKTQLIKQEWVRSALDGRERDADQAITDKELNEVMHVTPIPTVVPSDSSQMKAITRVVGHYQSLVIQGPPGTGKSQTITNLIAATLAAGRSVLFVAEKMAALSVVRERLEEAGLGRYCLELHSAKATPKQVLEQFRQRLVHRPKASPLALQHSANMQRMNLHRNALANYGEAIESTRDALGVSFQAAVWREAQAELQLGRSLEDKKQVASAVPALDAETDPSFESLDALHGALKVASRCVADGVNLAAAPWKGTRPKVYPNTSMEQGIRDALIRTRNLTQQWAEAEARMPLPDQWKHMPIGHWLVVAAEFRSNESPPVLPAAICSRVAENVDQVASYRSYVSAMQAWSRHAAPEARALSEKAMITDDTILAAMKAAGQLQGAMIARFSTDTLGDLIEANKRIEWLKNALRKRCDDLNQLKTLLHLPVRSEVYADGNKLALAAQKVASLPPVVWRVFESSLLRPSVQQHYEQALEHTRTLVKERDDLQKHLRMSFMPDDELWMTLSADLKSTEKSWFKWLPGTKSYKFRQRFRAYFQQMPAKEGDSIAIMDRGCAWRKRVADFAADVDLRAILGSAFSGIETDWLNFAAALKFLREWADQYDGAATLALIEHKDECANNVLNITRLSAEVLKCHASIMDTARVLYRQDETTLSHLSEQALQVDTETQASEAAGLLEAIQLLEFPKATLTRSVSSLGQVALELRTHKSEVIGLVADDAFLGALHKGMIGTDVAIISAAIDWIDGLLQTSVLPQAVKLWVLAEHAEERVSEVANALSDVLKSISESRQSMTSLADFVHISSPDALLSADNSKHTSVDLVEIVEKALSSIHVLGPWYQLCESEDEIVKTGGAEVWDWCQQLELSATGVEAAANLAFWSRVVADFMKFHPDLQYFHRQKLEEHRAEFAKLDKNVGNHLRHEIDRAVFKDAASTPQGKRTGSTKEYTEMGLLANEAGKKKRHVPVRRLLKQSANALKHLMPCWMMGPQAVAQFLEPEHIEFDLLVIDEASQVRPEDALGALARAKQIVIVGDSKQMPPTDVFRAIGASDDDEIEDDDGELVDVGGPAAGLDSILDLYQAQLPSEMLCWHYRSQHQQLIAYSNEQFYGGELIVPPSRWHDTEDLGVRRHYIEKGRLQNRKNVGEVEKVIELMSEHVLRQFALARGRESLGVVAMNSDQQSLIAEHWEAACKADANLDEAQNELSKKAKIFIRNLENVQGDERDVIIISTTYAKSGADGQMYQRFGPINKPGGWRRLNVLFTRARKRIHLVTSLHHTEVLPADNAADSGRNHLRRYLQFAENGHLPDSGTGIIKNAPDSDFEVSVSQQIASMGYQLHFQVGVQGFFIDIGVLHPDGNRYMCGIECDGAAYHSHPLARDRDRIRQEILETRGWNIYRIWSTDWYRNRTIEVERLRSHLAKVGRV